MELYLRLPCMSSGCEKGQLFLYCIVITQDWGTDRHTCEEKPKFPDLTLSGLIDFWLQLLHYILEVPIMHIFIEHWFFFCKSHVHVFEPKLLQCQKDAPYWFSLLYVTNYAINDKTFVAWTLLCISSFIFVTENL